MADGDLVQCIVIYAINQKLCFSVIAENIEGLDELWFLGDNFVARCYHQFFRNAPETGKYIKERFEVSAYCNSHFISNELNIVIRLKNALMMAIEKKVKLPKYIVVVLENDILEYTRYNGPGISGILGRYTEGITSSIQNIVHIQNDQLPLKTKRIGYPMIYWVSAVHHKAFKNGPLCTKFNHCLEAAVRLYDNMRVIKIKEVWNFENISLVNNNEMTPSGLSAYWKAVDASMHFNVKRNEKANSVKNVSAKKQLKLYEVGQQGPANSAVDTRDLVAKLFARNKMRNKNNRDVYHWSKNMACRLPKPPSPPISPTTTVVTVNTGK